MDGIVKRIFNNSFILSQFHTSIMYFSHNSTTSCFLILSPVEPLKLCNIPNKASSYFCVFSYMWPIAFNWSCLWVQKDIIFLNKGSGPVATPLRNLSPSLSNHEMLRALRKIWDLVNPSSCKDFWIGFRLVAPETRPTTNKWKNNILKCRDLTHLFILWIISEFYQASHDHFNQREIQMNNIWPLLSECCDMVEMTEP